MNNLIQKKHDQLEIKLKLTCFQHRNKRNKFFKNFYMEIVVILNEIKCNYYVKKKIK